MIVARRLLPASQDRYCVRLSSRRAIGKSGLPFLRQSAQPDDCQQSGNIVNLLPPTPPNTLAAQPGLLGTPVSLLIPVAIMVNAENGDPEAHRSKCNLDRNLLEQPVVGDAR